MITDAACLCSQLNSAEIGIYFWRRSLSRLQLFEILLQHCVLLLVAFIKMIVQAPVDVINDEAPLLFIFDGFYLPQHEVRLPDKAITERKRRYFVGRAAGGPDGGKQLLALR